MNLKKILVLAGAVVGLGLGLWFNPSSALSVLGATVAGALAGNLVHYLVEH